MIKSKDIINSDSKSRLDVLRGLMENPDELNHLDEGMIDSIFNIFDDQMFHKELLNIEKVDLERGILNGLNNRRSEIEILAYILQATSRGINKTALFYEANLSGRQLKKYLAFLIGGGFLKKENGKNRGALLTTTSRGNHFLYHWIKIIELMETGP